MDELARQDFSWSGSGPPSRLAGLRTAGKLRGTPLVAALNPFRHELSPFARQSGALELHGGMSDVEALEERVLNGSDDAFAILHVHIRIADVRRRPVLRGQRISVARSSTNSTGGMMRTPRNRGGKSLDCARDKFWATRKAARASTAQSRRDSSPRQGRGSE
jgi:hypothetical protein